MRIGQVGGAGGSGGGGGSQDAFTIIQPETGTSPTADSPTSTLTITADQSINVVGDSSTKKITLNGVAFTGDAGSGGSLGMVPAPSAGDGSTKFLRADGTWQIPTGLSISVTAGWGFSGNAGTNPAIHFVGTADNTSFNVGVSSIFRMTFGASGPIDAFEPIRMRSADGIAFYAVDNASAVSIVGHSVVAGYTLKLPSAIGTTNQVLALSDPTTGQLAFQTVTSGSGGQSFAIPWGVSLGGTGSTTITNFGAAYGTSTGYAFTSQGSTNQVLVGGVGAPGWTSSPQINSMILGITGIATGALSFAHLNSNNLISFSAGASSLAQSYIWPTSDGTNGQVFTTNGAGVLSWSTVSGGGGGGGQSFAIPWGVTLGGVGRTSMIQFGVAYGTSTGMDYTAQGQTWAMLISDGAAPGWTTSPTTLGLRLGVASQQTGSFRFAHANSANEITFRGASGMAAATYIFPPTDGATFAPLVTNSAGQMSWLALKSNCTFTIDGGGSAITTGVKGYVRVPFNCVITGWDIVADQSGSIVVDVWKDTYANFPPTVADTIAGSEKPTLSSAQKNQDLSLSTWTTNLTDGDYLGFNVDSVSTVTRVTVTLICTRMG